MTASTEQSEHPVAVIGGGIVGLCCALYLQREGRRVLLVDREAPGESTAKWSCGQMAVSEIIPISKPGLFKKVPGWLFDQLGPLSLRPAAIPQLVPWMVRFASNARMARIRQIAGELGSLTQHAFDDYAPLLDALDDSEVFNPNPPVQVFQSAQSHDEEKRYAAMLGELGFAVEDLTAEQIAELEPAIAGHFQHGVLLHDWRTVRDTESFLLKLTALFEARGGQRLTDTALDIECRDQSVAAIQLEQHGRLPVSNLVVAAGHGSRCFFRRLGVRAPLIGIAGYQALVQNPNVHLQRSIVYSDGGFGLVPMTRGLQIGGTIEFAGRSEVPNFERAHIILKRAREILPALDTTHTIYGAGFRPALPDTKPVIDRAPAADNAVLAFGHGQLGLTLGATTGRLVADLVAQRTPADSLAPFSLARF
jgi:D-amino-acid dehydrogenase